MEQSNMPERALSVTASQEIGRDSSPRGRAKYKRGEAAP